MRLKGIDRCMVSLLQVCLQKRRKGLIKKAMELVLLTDAYTVISIYDQASKQVSTFKSHEIDPEFSEI